jgi:hypothetical protein
VIATVEEERDNVIPEHSSEGQADGGDAVDPAWRRTGWRRCRRRGRRKFWQPDDVQVKILQLGFKDRETGGFIGRP